MASEVRRFMKSCQPNKSAGRKILTRPQRKKALREYTSLINDIMEAEMQYRDSIPEQFEQRIETADCSVDQMAEAIALLDGAY